MRLDKLQGGLGIQCSHLISVVHIPRVYSFRKILGSFISGTVACK